MKLLGLLGLSGFVSVTSTFSGALPNFGSKPFTTLQACWYRLGALQWNKGIETRIQSHHPTLRSNSLEGLDKKLLGIKPAKVKVGMV